MSWFWTVIFLSFIISINLSEAKHHQKLPSVIVVGTVYCDTCFQQDFPHATHFIAGASVAVKCKETSSRPGFRQEVKTNNHGEFKIHLPFSVSKHVKKIRGCSVELIRSNEPFCAVAATATSSSIHLKSRKEGAHIFSAGFFTFKPLKQPQVCDQKPISIKNFKNSADQKLSPISNPNDPNKFLPPPHGVPYLPPVPKKENAAKASQLLGKKVNQPMSLPFLPNPFNPPSIFPPNPFQPPPSIFPPIFPTPPPSIFPPIFPAPTPPPSIFPPIFPAPTPPPSIFPPIFPTPTPPSPPFFHLPPIPGLIPSPLPLPPPPTPSPPFFHLPPIPGLIPSPPPLPPPPTPSPPFFHLPPIPGLVPSPPPPPPPPTFPIPLPPFPFQPTPGFPGVPPAEVSSQSRTSHP